MDGLQHLHHSLRGAAVEVVDIQDDSLHRLLQAVHPALGRGDVVQDVLQPLHVLADHVDQAEVPLIAAIGEAFGHESHHAFGGTGFPHILMRLFDRGLGGVQFGLAAGSFGFCLGRGASGGEEGGVGFGQALVLGLLDSFA